MMTVFIVLAAIALGSVIYSIFREGGPPTFGALKLAVLVLCFIELLRQLPLGK